MKLCSRLLSIDTEKNFEIVNLTPQICTMLAASKILNGLAIVTAKHTTTALFVNEYEDRLLEDIKTFFNKLIPADRNYLHNDIHLRDCPPEEPENAHSHIIAMLLNNSEIISIVNGELALGQWQSVMLAELDGPRQRSIQVQFIGETN